MPFLDADEWGVLATQCQLVTAAERDPLYSVAAQELLDKNRCRELLTQLTPIIGSPPLAVTASLLSKRIAFLTTASCLYSMSAFNKGLNFSLDNSVVEYRHQQNLWRSRMPIIELSVSEPQADARQEWRAQICHHLFTDNLARLWSTFAEVSGISEIILWENTAVRVYSLYERRLTSVPPTASIQTPEQRLQQQQRIADDFQFLVQHAPSEWFLQKRNPLQRYFKTKQKVGDQSIRFRRTCCFYYKATQPQEYCSNCPLIKPAKRNIAC